MKIVKSSHFQKQKNFISSKYYSVVLCKILHLHAQVTIDKIVLKDLQCGVAFSSAGL